MIIIDKAKGHQSAGKETGSEKIGIQPEGRIKEEKTYGCQDLDERISPRNSGAAETAFPAEQQERNYRNIVIDFYSFFALRAGGGRPDKA
jgi:hypothetical protein